MGDPHQDAGAKTNENDLLLLAALFEGDFSVDWLQALSGAKASEIFMAIETGISDGLLARKPDGMTCFIDKDRQHVLRSILPEGRKNKLHLVIVRLILQDAQINENLLQTAASHLLKIENDPEGCRWLVKAGDFYSRAYQYKDALACYKKVLVDLPHDDSPEAVVIFVNAVIGYSRISDAEADLTEVNKALKVALKKITHAGEPAQQARVEMHLAKNEWLLSNFDSALKHFSNAQAIAATCDSPRLRRSMVSFSTFFLFVQGRMKEVIKYYEEFMPEVEKYPKSRWPMLSASVVGLSYAFTGHISQGMGMLDAINAQTLSSGDDYVASFTEYAFGLILMMMNRTDEAVIYLEKAIARGEKAPNHTVIAGSTAFLSVIYARQGHKKKAVDLYNRFLELNRKVKMDRTATSCFLELGKMVEDGSMPPLPELSFTKEIKRSLKVKSILMKGIAYRFSAVHRKSLGESTAIVVKELKESLKWLIESGNLIETALTRFELARIYLQSGEEKRARVQSQTAAESLDALSLDIIPEDLKGLVADFRGDNKLLEEIMKLSQDLVGIQEHREVVKKIISTAIKVTGAERGAIFIPNPDNPAFPPLLQAAKNLPQEEIMNGSFAPSMDIIRNTAETGKSCIKQIKTCAETASSLMGIICSCICIPMKLRADVVGVLYLDNRLLSNTFQDSDLEVLSYFAALAAIAMDNAKAYEKIQALNQKLSEEKQYYHEQNMECFHFDDFVGKSRAIMRVLSNIQDVAETLSTVLILGETGVGKELVARSIHRLSLRCNKPFIRVNCNAFPESLIASEFFGHERGAFTGANDRRIGRFELADGGTLFLDEIGDISLDVQVRLLRVLQTKEFERLGGKETLRSDFRLIAATNRDLEKAVKNGNFREDLYYRLNVFPITVPPLRERRDDIPVLAQYFLDIYATKMGKSPLLISNTDMDRMIAYDWPGNVRELENLIERGTILSSGKYFSLPELKRTTIGSDSSREAITLSENERRHIQWALKVTGGKIRGKNGAAELLDIHPNTLYGRMNKLGIKG
jgi:transcriptional regulator with GAF, ATPase, and Fis domain